MMRALICITTSNRNLAIKALAWNYISFCKSTNNFDFLIALDGNDKKTISFCQKQKIPILYSEDREGVGLSKNRVLKTYQNYDHYFFIEDDVGLINPDVFYIYIDAARELDLHHMSLSYEDRIIEKTDEITLRNGLHVICSNYGSGLFNYFSRYGINKVGGFHTHFAKYRRFGHTEHSYRFVNSGIARHPFYVISECTKGYLQWNDPVSVTKIKVDTVNRLFVEEQEIINSKIENFELSTICEFTTPRSLEIENAVKPRFLLLYQLIFSGYNISLNTYRKAKKIWKKCSGK